MKMFQNGQIDAMTAMKMLAESTANNAPKTPVVSAPSHDLSRKNSIQDPSVGEKRPRSGSLEPTDVDSDSDLEGEDFKHIEPWVEYVA